MDWQKHTQADRNKQKEKSGRERKRRKRITSQSPDQRVDCLSLCTHTRRKKEAGREGRREKELETVWRRAGSYIECILILPSSSSPPPLLLFSRRASHSAFDGGKRTGMSERNERDSRSRSGTHGSKTGKRVLSPIPFSLSSGKRREREQNRMQKSECVCEEREMEATNR